MTEQEINNPKNGAEEEKVLGEAVEEQPYSAYPDAPTETIALEEEEEELTGEKITEQMGKQKEWYKDASSPDMTLDKLPKFLEHLTNDYKHDYGTICHAMAAGAVATAWAINRTPQGGITGFQASAVMWEFITNWMQKTGPLELVDYSSMLFPQYEENFQKVITESVWNYLQTEAKKCLAQDGTTLNKDVKEHWQSIVDGKVPFDYSVKLKEMDTPPTSTGNGPVENTGKGVVCPETEENKE